MAQRGNIKANYTDGKSVLSVALSLIKFEEDGVYAVYSPALDLFGYGNTETEADNSFKTVLDEFIRYTAHKGTFQDELKRLGWEVKKGKKYKAPLLEEMMEHNSQLSEIMNTKPFTHTQQNVSMPIYV